jgi:hypothetical protein
MLNVADNEHIHCVVTFKKKSFRCMCLASHGASVVIGKRSGVAKMTGNPWWFQNWQHKL